MNEVLDDRPLTTPITDESPCGQILDPSELLAFDAYRVFGQQVALDAPLEINDGGRESERRRTPKPADSPEWLEIRDRALAALARSKDLRVLALLGAALLRIEGPYAFCQVVSVASAWLAEFWDTVHPVAADDTIERQSALSAFNDYFAIVDPLRRAPLVSSRRHGHLSLRDLEQVAETPAVAAAFDELSLIDLRCASQRVVQARHAVTQIEERIKGADADPVLSLDDLSTQLERLDRVLRGQLGRRPESGVAAEVPLDGSVRSTSDGGITPGAIGAIRTREDAIRALDAVATFFREAEPSSPVPLLLDRAKRLVSKNFLEVLADLAPGALGEARVASGVRNE